MKRLFLGWLAALLLAACLPPQGAYQIRPGVNGCDLVPLDSLDGYAHLRHDKIVGISRARGRTGPIVWVDVVPPTAMGEVGGVSRMRSMRLWWNSHGDVGPLCRIGPDLTMKVGAICGAGIHETDLELIASFDPVSTDIAEARMAELVTYVSEEVLCDGR